MTKPEGLAKIHEEFASGKRFDLSGHFHRRDGGLDLEDVKLIAMAARFHANCGRDRAAADLLQIVNQMNFEKLGTEAQIYLANSNMFFDYEVKRDFFSAKERLIRTVNISNNVAENPDINLIVGSSYWRLSAIELSHGNRSASDRLMNISYGMIKELKVPHMLCVIHLANGFRHIAQQNYIKAKDELLKGLFQVDYGEHSIPEFVHAEIMLGLYLIDARNPRKENRQPHELLNPIVTLDKIRSSIANGRGSYITPYRNIRSKNPSRLLEHEYINLVRDGIQATHFPSISKRIRKEAKARNLDYCIRCKSSTDLTIDHIVPRSWGGRDWDVNLRILCRKCNSSRSKYFRWHDNHAYDRLR